MKFINRKQWNFLTKKIANNSLVGAYLFCGPAKVGKNKMVFDFVRKVNKLGEDLKIETGIDPDVIILEPIVEEKAQKKRKKAISIEQVKEAVKKVGYYAYKAEYQFLIINEADNMTASAANSLLKIMEEPTTDTIVILISDNELRLLSTIRSRCQIVRFGIASDEDISRQLQAENSAFKKADLAEIVDFSQGKIIKAQQFLANPAKFQTAKENLENFRNALKQGVIEGLSLAEELANDKEKLKESLEEIIWYLRELIKKQLALGADVRVSSKIAHIIEKAMKLRAEITNSNVNQRLQLENFFVQL